MLKNLGLDHNGETMVKQQSCLGFFPPLEKVTFCKPETVLLLDLRTLYFAYSEETFLYQETLEFKVQVQARFLLAQEKTEYKKLYSNTEQIHQQVYQ